MMRIDLPEMFCVQDVPLLIVPKNHLDEDCKAISNQ